MSDFLQTVRERVVIYDGAMGTNIQKRNATLDDYWGKENCSEVLVLSRPDIIGDLHADFFGVGCDVVETDTFGGTGIVLAEFGLADRVAEINLAAVKIAREVAKQFSTKDRPRFVAGSIGPTTKLPSVGHIKFDEIQYINDTALFKNQWQLKTASQEDYVRLVEPRFRPIKMQLQEEIITSGIFEPKVVYGYFPAQADGNDVIVYEAESNPDNPKGHEGSQRKGELLRFTFPRQREGRKLCISDFFAPKSSGKMDVIGLSLVTIGSKASEETQRLFEGGEYTRYLYLHGLSVETAEALAEYLHKKMREELGIEGEDSAHIRDLFHQKYQGSRYSFGYPACPNLEDQTKLFALLRPEENVGVKLTTGFLLEPEQSTSAIVVHHPQAKYFVV
jgi:cobalamin-dependent methionine synthase I